MKIAVIGKGNVGGGLAKVLGDAGHQVTAIGRGGDIAVTVAAAEAVILATPYGASLDVASKADFTGKLVIDVSNPVTEDFQALQVGHTTSAAEEIAKLMPGARVAKAFNTTFAQHYGTGLNIDGKPLQTFVAADQAETRDAVKALAAGIGFDPVDAGPLSNARYIEGAGYLNIQLGIMLGRGTNIAPFWQFS